MDCEIIEENINEDTTCVICLEKMSPNKKSICSQCNICIVCNNCIIKSMEEGIFNQKCFTCNKEYPWCTFHFNKKTSSNIEIKRRTPCNIRLLIISFLIILLTTFIGFITSTLLNLKLKKKYNNDHFYIYISYFILGMGVIALVIYFILYIIMIRSIANC